MDRKDKLEKEVLLFAVFCETYWVSILRTIHVYLFQGTTRKHWFVGTPLVTIREEYQPLSILSQTQLVTAPARCCSSKRASCLLVLSLASFPTGREKEKWILQFARFFAWLDPLSKRLERRGYIGHVSGVV